MNSVCGLRGLWPGSVSGNFLIEMTADTPLQKPIQNCKNTSRFILYKIHELAKNDTQNTDGKKETLKKKLSQVG